MIEVPAFLDLHTHTRYPDKSFFPANDIEKSAMNGGYSDILAMPNSEIVIDDIEALNYAREIDSSLNLNIHRVGALSKNLSGKELVDFKSFIQNGITIFSDDGKSLIEDTLADEAFKIIAELGGAIFQHCEKNCFSNPGDIAPPSNSSELILIPDSEEFEILKRDLDLVEKYNTRYHAQHLSSKRSVELIEQAKNKQLPVTSEVTPHHLLIFTLDELLIFLVDKPRKILNNLGYEINEPFHNQWIEGVELFNTKSEYKNSAFENFEVNIKKVDLYV